MKRILFVTLLCLSFSATAQFDEKVAKAAKHSGSFLVGFGAGGTAFGFAYEFMPDQSLGFDGHLRVFPKDNQGANQSQGLMVLGGSMVHHFYKRSWDLAFSPSFNIINIDATNGNDQTTFGPGLSISLMTQLTDQISVGFDNSRYWIWFDDDFRGSALDDFAIRIRSSF